MVWDNAEQDRGPLDNLKRLKQLGAEITNKQKIDGFKTKIETEAREKEKQERTMLAGEGREKLAEICGRLIAEILDGVPAALPIGDSGVRIEKATLEFALPLPEGQPPESALEQSKWDLLDFAAVRVSWTDIGGEDKSKRGLLLYSNGGAAKLYDLWELRFGDNPLAEPDHAPRLRPKPWYPDLKNIDSMITGEANELEFAREGRPIAVLNDQAFCDYWWGCFCEAIKS